MSGKEIAKVIEQLEAAAARSESTFDRLVISGQRTLAQLHAGQAAGFRFAIELLWEVK